MLHSQHSRRACQRKIEALYFVCGVISTVRMIVSHMSLLGATRYASLGRRRPFCPSMIDDAIMNHPMLKAYNLTINDMSRVVSIFQ